jgi:hypothetical protein
MHPAPRQSELAQPPLFCPPAAAVVLGPDVCPITLDRTLDEYELRVKLGKLGDMRSLLAAWDIVAPIVFAPASQVRQ